MNETLLFTQWCIVIGTLLIAMTLSSSYIARLPLSAAMLYLLVGFGIGPAGLGLLEIDPLKHALLLERLTEVAVLISLFNAGFKLELPLSDRRWRLPVQLATLSMAVTVGAITAIGVWLLHLPLGAAVLLGAILAPTDPVLASDVQVEDVGDRDRLRFGLTGEGGLNDGSAFPFAMLGLGLLGLHELGEGGWRWWTLDVAWAVAGGLAIGYLLGMLVGRAVMYLRCRHREALGADEFVAFGLIALAYGLALLCKSYGFLAVFAAGLALRRVDDSNEPDPAASMRKTNEQPPGKGAGDGTGTKPAPAAAGADTAKADAAETGTEAAGTEAAGTPPADVAPARMKQAVQSFNTQLEHFAEVGVVLAVGALVAVIDFGREVLWFVPLLFFVVRPLSVWIGLFGLKVSPQRRWLMSWFGIRGIGSIYYLMYAISHELDPELARRLLALTIPVIVASVIAHGISVTPLMDWYERRLKGGRERAGSEPRDGER